MDNGSTDDSVSFVERRFPQVNIIRHHHNLGFSRGYNLAVPNSRGRYLVFLNNDAIVAPGWLEALLGPLVRDPRAGLTTSKVVFVGTTKVNSMGGCFKLWTGASELGLGDESSSWTSIREPFYGNGVAMATPRVVFEIVAGFDDHMFAYGEDLDISWRIRLAGYKILCVPQSLVYHLYSGSWGRLNPTRVRLVTRNHLRAMFKCLSWANFAHAIIAYVLFSLSKGTILSIMARDLGYLRYTLLAVCDTVRDYESLHVPRKTTQALRKISDWRVLRAEGSGLFHSPRELLSNLHTIRTLSTYTNVGEMARP